MKNCIPEEEERFFALFKEYFDAEKDAGKQHDAANYSLDRMYPLAELAGNPERRLKLLHVAGTKGKGTTTQFTDALIRACGLKCGFFASPHICTYRERFQLNGKLPEYARLYEAGREIAEAVRSAGLHPSLFEIFTVMALKLFADEGLEYAVLETGIGGRLDATNYIKSPVMTYIAPVSFDHIALLGNTIEQIAGEKAGIIKPGVPLVLLKQPYPAAEEVICRQADKLGAPVLRPVSAADAASFLPDKLPDFLVENFCGALAGVRALGLNPLPQNFEVPQFRARFEKVSDEPLVLLDGAHNGDSMEKLVESLKRIYPGTAWNVVLGCVKGKDVKGMAAALKKLDNAQFILTNPRTMKGSALAELEKAMCELPVKKIIPDLRSREQLPASSPLLFTGSFFTTVIGEELFNP